MSDILTQLKRMPEYDELRWAAILEIERLRAVVDAARKRCHKLISANPVGDFAGDLLEAGVRSILRALDGDP